MECVDVSGVVGAMELANLSTKLSYSLSKNTDYLILGGQPGSKAKKAKELNVKTINENEWIKIIKELSN